MTARPQALTIGYGFWLMVLVLMSFAIIGGTGVLWAVFRMSTSDERRSAWGRRSEPLVPVTENDDNFPSIPDDEGLTNSPGTELAYRLPPAHSPGWSLLAATVFCLSWNGSVFALVGYAVQSFVAGKPEWLLTALLGPFIGIGGWSVFYLGRLLYRLAGLGPTTLEISAHPLIPGESYEIALSQGGHIHANYLEVWLVCEEEATYCQGTDVRTEQRVVFEQQLFRAESIEINPATPYKQAIHFEMPLEAMHSFQSPHNGVQWRLEVDGAVLGWADFERGFPVIVHPSPRMMQAWAPTPPKFLPTTPQSAELMAAAEVSA